MRSAREENLKEKLLFALAFSDEGLMLMFHRLTRENPTSTKKEIYQLLHKELVAHGAKGLPKYLVKRDGHKGSA